jgi:hypothetical protein
VNEIDGRKEWSGLEDHLVADAGILCRCVGVVKWLQFVACACRVAHRQSNGDALIDARPR